MANFLLTLPPFSALAILCVFLILFEIGNSFPPTTRGLFLDLDKIDGISVSARSSEKSSPAISGGSTPDMVSAVGRRDLRLQRSASVATERVAPKVPNSADSGGNRSPATLRKHIMSPVRSRTPSYQKTLSSPRNNPLLEYRPVNSLCLPGRRNLFRSKSSTDRWIPSSGSSVLIRKNSSKKNGTKPTNVSNPPGVGSSREANAQLPRQLSRESSGGEKKQRKKKQQKEDEEKGKAKLSDGMPNTFKTLKPKACKKSEEKESGHTPNKLNRLVRQLLNLRKNKAETKPQKNDSLESISSRETLSSPEKKQQMDDHFSDTSSFQGFPSPDFNFLESPNFFPKSGESSNSGTKQRRPSTM